MEEGSQRSGFESRWEWCNDSGSRQLFLLVRKIGTLYKSQCFLFADESDGPMSNIDTLVKKFIFTNFSQYLVAGKPVYSKETRLGVYQAQQPSLSFTKLNLPRSPKIAAYSWYHKYSPPLDFVALQNGIEIDFIVIFFVKVKRTLYKCVLKQQFHKYKYSPLMFRQAKMSLGVRFGITNYISYMGSLC